MYIKKNYTIRKIEEILNFANKTIFKERKTGFYNNLLTKLLFKKWTRSYVTFIAC